MADHSHASDPQEALVDEAVFHERYPSRRLLDLIANRWTPIVLFCLASGTHHYGQMQRRIPGISKKMLSQTLRRLETDGLVHREVYRVVPPKTEYELTELGWRLHEPVRFLCRWATENAEVFDRIERNRTAAAVSE
ncbi:helix-turn-helix domain-containing protein [uncultured Roseobacter sp.]|uniref:winged helix-turn-helix transcriptional regulator n=1 Tax=uncultured Roseobacter sp. TaxID=114847 RepID=UPI002618147C|nr:helix-turn-helix domain-containing protein [uncultured Roseobacter sp.]